MEGDVSMEGLTTFRVGGRADLVVYPRHAADLKALLSLAHEEEVPVLVLGLGSNLLVTDEGIRGVVVNLREGFKTMSKPDKTKMLFGAGVSLAKATAKTAGKGLKGLEFLSGIPGTMGGAVRMNAGAFGCEMKDVIEAVSFMNRKGDVFTLQREGLSFSYRNLALPEGDIILDCLLSLEEGDAGKIRERIRENALKRTGKQPYDKPTAGSVFKNPPHGFAGRLIEEAGLKGLQVGGAKVSEKHANFIENLGDASSADIIALMERMRNSVFEKSGILLEPEIRIVGEGAESAPALMGVH